MTMGASNTTVAAPLSDILIAQLLQRFVLGAKALNFGVEVFFGLARYFAITIPFSGSILLGWFHQASNIVGGPSAPGRVQAVRAARRDRAPWRS
jgi:hypothetical protein